MLVARVADCIVVVVLVANPADALADTCHARAGRLLSGSSMNTTAAEAAYFAEEGTNQQVRC